jgi:hypothetical protein
LICAEISTFVSKYYVLPACLFVIDGFEISSKEDATQGDPSQWPYAVAIPLLLMVVQITDNLPGLERLFLSLPAC